MRRAQEVEGRARGHGQGPVISRPMILPPLAVALRLEDVPDGETMFGQLTRQDEMVTTAK